MKSSYSGWVRSIISIMGLSVCLVFVSLTTTAGAAAPTVTSEALSPAAATTGGSPPVIQAFKANPMTLETPTSTAVYAFKVKRAKNVTISEAGNNIKNISNPSGAALNGTATGMPASAISTDASGKFKAVLIASNDDGAVKAELTLSFSEKLLAASGKPAVESDNQTQSSSPKWLDQYPSPFGQPRSAMTGSEPKFFDCPSDCDYCLKAEEAKSQGMERCSEERCYYSPDNQQNWYCFKPAPGWCCSNLNVSQATKDECTKMGGTWFLNQSDALDQCQPLGYCCQNGTIYQATKSQCAQSGGTYYATVIEAKERCQPPCWCCAYGKVFQTSQAACLQSGGNCYASQAQALQYCQQQSSCWCCAYGKVFQSTQSQCAQSGGNCYDSQSIAQRYCEQQSTCWCCAKGQVFQTTKSSCAQAGGSCYSSQSEATAACRQTIPYLK